MDFSRFYVLPSMEPFFAGVVEEVFISLGVADPPLLDYVTTLLSRFTRVDQIYRLRTLSGKQIQTVTGMWQEAEACIGEARRQRLQHLGDFTLFWVGVYPEMLEKLQDVSEPDYLFQYPEVGKKAYYHASLIPVSDDDETGEVLVRMSRDYELLRHGLGEARKEWEHEAALNRNFLS